MNASSIPLRIMAPAILNMLRGKKSPIKVGLQITTDCNMDCSYCYTKDTGAQTLPNLTLDKQFTVIDDLKKMNISILSFTGGEPLLCKDLDLLIEHAAKKNKLLTGVATNGTLLTDDIARNHKTAGLSWYHMTVDGVTEKEYQKQRGSGNFSGVDNAIDIANKHDIRVIVTTVVTKNNFDKMGEIADYLVRKGIKMWSPTLAVPCGKGKEFLKDNLFSKDEVFKIYSQIHDMSIKYKKSIAVYPMDSQVYYSIACSRGKASVMKKIMYGFMGGCAVVKGTTIHVNVDGSVKPCAYFGGNVPDTNVLKESIIDIFRSHPYLKRLRNPKLLEGKCRDCEYKFCCGGCRSRAFALTGSEFSEDPYCRLTK